MSEKINILSEINPLRNEKNLNFNLKSSKNLTENSDSLDALLPGPSRLNNNPSTQSEILQRALQDEKSVVLKPELELKNVSTYDANQLESRMFMQVLRLIF